MALVDFEGQLLAAALSEADLCGGQVDLPVGRLQFWFDDAMRHRAAAVDFHSKQRPIPGVAEFVGTVSAPEFHNRQNLPAAAMEFQSNRAILIRGLPSKQRFISAITALQAEMRDGYSYLVNYCSQSMVEMHYSPAELFAAAKAPYKFWLEGHFLSFSPEAFVTVRGLQITTTPMKGTGTDRAALLSDAKEQAEHATVVDLLRNDLGQVARQVRVEDYRYVSEIRRGDGSALYQTSSRICGEMPPDWRSHIGDWLPRLLPAGSISGAPKKETLELIRRFEDEPRGFFTGVAVLFDGENLFSAVLIRFLDLAGEVQKFRSGAGITIYSDPEQEYDEVVSKVYFPV